MNKIDEVLNRGVAAVLPTKEALRETLLKRKITLYQGFDPTAPSLHVGHFIGIRKLHEFQELGHRVIFLIGDFTAMIGDPTDKKAARTKLTKEEVLKNLRDYKKQVERIIRFDGANPAEIMFNSTWLSKLNFEEILELATNFTVQQMIERDMFANRIKEEKPIYLHEFLYPLMQGYDSVAMDVDLEVGGNDQLFNMLAGRILMKNLKNKDKFVLTMKLLTDDQGKKMGKTEGNAIFLSDSPSDVFGKVMAFNDAVLTSAIELLTDLPLDTVEKVGPLESKKVLGYEVVKQIHGEEKAREAKEYFEKTFQGRSPDYSQKIKSSGILSATISELVGSNSEAKRLIAQGAVDVNGTRVSDPTLMLKGGEKIKIGKRIFVTVK
ncbi:MAG TPA: tyrosine--tRNA ligase [Patescibacteria group bacterium]